MRVYRVSLPDLYQVSSNDQAAVIGQLVSLFAGPMAHCRLLTFAVPATLDALEAARRKLAMSRREQWERRGLIQEAQMIAELGKSGDMRKARHYLIDFNDSITARDLGNWWVLAEPEYPLLPIPGDYAERPDHMLPVIKDKSGRWVTDHGRYKYGAISSYQLSRNWDWRHPLADVIAQADGPMVICVDVRKIHPERVAGSAEFWEGMVLNGQDRTAVMRKQEAEAALSLRDEAVHHVRVLFMVLDKSMDKLRERLDSLRKSSIQFMKVDRLLGYQAAATAMFGPAARPAGMPSGHFNALSRAPAVIAGMWGVGREQPQDGVYIGLSVDDVARHVCFLEWRGNDPFHGMILGKTGKGKTVAANALAWRLAEQGAQVILLEPQGHSRRLARLAQGKNVAYNQLSYEETRFNILDVVYENTSDQYDHVITLLGLLLDPLGNNPRRFSNAEIAAVRKALQLTYARYDWQQELLADQSLTPTLRVLCSKLEQVADEYDAREPARPASGGGLAAYAAPFHVANQGVGVAARQLAEEISSLYVYGDYAANFNTPTNLDLNLAERIVLFDFSQVPARRRGLFYYITLASLNRQIRRQPRRRVVIVDEVHYMNQEPALMEFLAYMVKTVRTFGCAVIAIDQDLEAFIGVEGAQAESAAGGQNITAGQFMINNVSWTIIFGVKRDAAYRLMNHYPDEILPTHAEFLARMGSKEDYGKGMAIVRYNGRADMVYWKLRPMEEEALFGS
jgi:Cdc6-like AAA superfamily ATPase